MCFLWACFAVNKIVKPLCSFPRRWLRNSRNDASTWSTLCWQSMTSGMILLTLISTLAWNPQLFLGLIRRRACERCLGMGVHVQGSLFFLVVSDTWMKMSRLLLALSAPFSKSYLVREQPSLDDSLIHDLTNIWVLAVCRALTSALII